ncbi:putative ras GTPase-activating protein nGAP [Triplophysa rosa]|uniref:Ras GTPase-activating protein nGAP n=1 Tax=Triplophysa rosa TaxID=992332 RepID=A0A9W8C718_TRIRA|nr:putative ras GTPase-activating protein nGAP [Triplophysa rosa]
METDSMAGGDVESVQGGMISLDPVVDGILMDSFCQQQGWVRVYGGGKILYGAIDPIDMLPGAVVMVAGLLKDRKLREGGEEPESIVGLCWLRTAQDVRAATPPDAIQPRTTPPPRFDLFSRSS